jgi:helix-turn-helix protein
MTSYEIKSLLQEVFFEDEYEVSEKEYDRYEQSLKRFYLKVYSEKLKNHTSMIIIENYVIGNLILDDVWEMIWSLPNQNYYMKIPGTSTKRNPKDVGDPKAFLMISKEKLKDILLINKLNSNLMSDMKNMSEDSTRVIRDFKLNNLEI